MKILMTTDTISGVWQYSLDLSASLGEEQIEVVLLSMGPKPNESQLWQINEIPNLHLYHFDGKLEWMDEPWEDVKKAGKWLKEIIELEKPDLLHFNNYAHVGMDWEIPVVLVAHFCVSTWWKAVKKTSLPHRYDAYFQTVKQAFQKADVVVAPTQSILSQYQDVYGIAQNANVIYNALGNVPEEQDGIEKQAIIFSMGRLWDEAKNIRLLTEAADKINAGIYIAGDKENIFSDAENITFLGKLSRNEIFQWLKRSSIYVLPIKYESFGLSFLEAASQKCALIGGNIPTLHEIWGDSMIYVDPENAIQLAEQCNSLLSDINLRNELAEKAFEKSTDYHPQRKQEQYLNLYRNLISTRTQKLYA